MSLNTGNAILSNGITLDSSYNVGIGGAASGSYKLNVTGAGNFTGALTGASASFSSNVTTITQGASNGFNTGGLIAKSNGNTARYTQVGYDNSSNYGWIQAIEQGTAYTNLVLNGAGGIVLANRTSPINSGTYTTQKLQVTGGIGINSDAADGVARLTLLGNSSTGDGTIDWGGNGNFNLVFSNNGNERLKINSTGSTAFIFRNVSNEVMDLLVSTESSNPSKSKISLMWYGNETASIKFKRGGDATGGSIEFWTQTETGSISEKMSITSAGNVYIPWGTSKISWLYDASYEAGISFSASARQLTLFSKSGDGQDKISFQTGATPTERMQISSDGTINIANNSISWGYDNKGIKLSKSGVGPKISLWAESQYLFLGYAETNGWERVYAQATSGGVYLTNGATSWTANSDERLKNINSNIENALDKILTLRAVNYSWKNDDLNRRYLGLIAQDVEVVLPELVDKNEKDEIGTLGVRYTEMIPVLVKAIQEMNQTIQNQQQQINSLINR